MSSQSIAILCHHSATDCRKDILSLLNWSIDYMISFFDGYPFELKSQIALLARRFDSTRISRMLIYKFGVLEYQERRECI